MVQSFCSFRSRSQKRTGVFSGNKKLHFVEQTVVFCEGGLTTNRFGQASLCRLFLVSIASSSKKTCVLLQSPCWLVKSSQIACFVVTRCYKHLYHLFCSIPDTGCWNRQCFYEGVESTPASGVWQRNAHGSSGMDSVGGLVVGWFASGIPKVWISPAKLGISSTIVWYGGVSLRKRMWSYVQLDLSCGSKHSWPLQPWDILGLLGT